ncbi:hypothetical protein [Nannocystis bainbridge]|uniref:Uncharacterized protein n=1 Tax=Nannocystis bainbridge TaxID=2995303 RepID=A0ABT5E6U7_9BACT|nr:hypothetical protein [Nannocystis bainbridge]MDC0721581.1 hypothetical protein [Nannocystis bainbridge]
MQKAKTMSRFETTFRNAVANAERDVMIEQIRSAPHMSLAELGKLATGELGSLLKGITIGELLGQGGGAAAPAAPRGRGAGKPVKVPQALAKAPAAPVGRKGGRGAAAPAKEAPAPAAKRGSNKSVVDTRTPAGRDAYDQGMLNALKTAPGPQAAPDLSAVVGGTPLQVRTALARLIERGLVSWTGQARGTRYTAV